MPELIAAYVQNGTIVYNNEEPAVPTTSRVEGNVTINNIGQEAVPASFTVTFPVQSHFEVNGLDCRPYISVSVPVAQTSKDSSFRQIEREAADAIAPMLRMIADQIEAQLAAIKNGNEG